MNAPLTFLCRRMPPGGVRITPEQCAANRALPVAGKPLTRMEMLDLRKRGIDPEKTMPPACEHCKDWPELVRSLEPIPVVPAVEPKKRRSPGPGWTCLKCGDACGKPAARGLGWPCYWELKKAGRLDEYPLIGRGRKASHGGGPAAPGTSAPLSTTSRERQDLSTSKAGGGIPTPEQRIVIEIHLVVRDGQIWAQGNAQSGPARRTKNA